jgi:DNA-binding transcriptional LysR family regulator
MTRFADSNGELDSLGRLNLNLLYSLDAILNAPTLTAAGERIRLTQPAMSAALRRLRKQFGDELVIHKGSDRGLTKLGKVLRPRVRRLLKEADSVFGLQLGFDPETTRASITIGVSEEIEILLLGLAMPLILEHAKAIQVRAMPIADQSIASIFEQGADLVLTREALADPKFDSLPVVADYLSCLVAEENAQAGEVLTEAQFVLSRHAAMSDDSRLALNASSEFLDLLEHRDIAIRATSHLALASCLIGTDLVATGSVWMFQYFAADLPVRLASPPLPSEPTKIVAQWPKPRGGDPAIRWVLERLIEACGPLAIPRTAGHPAG